MILASISYRIGHLLNHAVATSNEAKAELTQSQDALITGVKMFAIIQFSAFIDEWKHQFLKLKTDGIETEKVDTIIDTVQPAWDVINLFPDIQTFRNRLLAHSSRTSRAEGYTNVYRGSLISTYVIPMNLNELQLVSRALQEIVNVAKQILADYFIPPTDFITRHTNLGDAEGRTVEMCMWLNDKMIKEIYGEDETSPAATPVAE